MKSTALTLVWVIVAVIGLHAFRSFQTTVLKGKMDADPRRCRILATNGDKKLDTGFSPDSSFSIALPRGKWSIQMIQWQPGKPGEISFIDSVEIGDAGELDLGIISR